MANSSAAAPPPLTSAEVILAVARYQRARPITRTRVLVTAAGGRKVHVWTFAGGESVLLLEERRRFCRWAPHTAPPAVLRTRALAWLSRPTPPAPGARA
jgi:hypothetical protein